MQPRGQAKLQQPETADGVLAQRTIAGDQRAFEILVQRYSSSLYSFIYRFVNDYDTARDVLQQVLLQLYISLPNLRMGEPLKAWLFHVARNRCLDELRKKRAIHFSEFQVGDEEDELSPLAAIQDGGPLPEEIAEHHDLQSLLQGAIATLPPKFRAVVALRYASQLSFSEIGRILRMPEATAKTYFQRAKPLLRRTLSGQLQVSPV